MMADTIGDKIFFGSDHDVAPLSLATTEPEVVVIDLTNSGCTIDQREIYLVNNQDVVIHQISQWLMVCILPFTTLIFIFAGVQAHRTHGCSFDSIVLYLCAFYNLFYMYEDLIRCTDPGQFLQIVFMTGVIQYLFFHFEEMLTSMDKDLQAIRNRYKANNSLSSAAR